MNKEGAGVHVKAENIVVLTGAGISAESGLKTFRDNDGLWEGHRVEDVATPEAFRRSPATVQRFYNMRRAQLQNGRVAVNAAHTALAQFEQQHRGQFTLITQNVDDLHRRAGSVKVLPMHGELLTALCQSCAATVDWLDDIDEESRCPRCGARGGLRPNIVWFGEMPYFMDVIEQALLQCDLFVSIGTSGAVYPAAGFQQLAQQSGATTVELNLQPSDTASLFDSSDYGPATQTVPAFFDLRVWQ